MVNGFKYPRSKATCCGLWGGYSGTLVGNEKEFVKLMAGLSFTRGVDSTGVTIAKEDKHNDYIYQTTRALFNPVTFFQDDRVDKLLDTPRTCVIMGHNRLATAGEINLENTQPIKRKNIILTHNGTIRSLTVKNSEVSDSNRLADIFEEKGVDEAIDRIGIGAAALVWLDTKEHTLNFFRNMDRPLCYAYNTAGSTMYWASEEWILKVASEKSRTPLEKIQKLDTDVHMFWEMDSMKEYRQPKKKYLYPVHYSSHNTNTKTYDSDGYAWKEYLDGKYGSYSTPTTPAKLLPPPKKETSVPEVKETKKIIKPEDSLFKISALGPKSFYCGWNNSAYSLQDIATLLDEKSCSFCLTHGDITKTVYWVSRSEYLCAACHLNPIIVNMYGPTHQGSIKKYN